MHAIKQYGKWAQSLGPVYDAISKARDEGAKNFECIKEEEERKYLQIIIGDLILSCQISSSVLNKG